MCVLPVRVARAANTNLQQIYHAEGTERLIAQMVEDDAELVVVDDACKYVRGVEAQITILLLVLRPSRGPRKHVDGLGCINLADELSRAVLVEEDRHHDVGDRDEARHVVVGEGHALIDGSIVGVDVLN